MQKFSFLILLFGVIFLVACGGAVSETSPPTPNPFPTDGSIPEDLIIRINRTPCYGTCPVYRMTVKADGNVKFFGQDHTEIKGETEGEISQEKIKQLIEEFKKANFFALQDKYTTEDCATDMPSANTTIFINGQVKKIEHNVGCKAPPELGVLENKIDEIVGTQKWIGKQK
jgi:hypothetical protein